MRRFKLEGAKNPEDWGWDKNPKNGEVYTFDQLEKMYGESELGFLIETIISTWEDDDWNESHGKWIEITDEHANITR